MHLTKIGWIGLGNMGIPMSQQLIKAGYPLTVYNRNKEKETELIGLGANTVNSPGELLAQTDIVFLMVSDDEAVRQLFAGSDGLLSANTTGKIIINMSTVSPGISKEFAALCSGQGNHYLDAPVSGSVKQAVEGQLVIMVGGEEAVFQKVQSILKSIGHLAMRVGNSGAGNAAKLAMNTLLAFHAQGLAEAVLFAQKQDIKTEDLLTLINNSAMGNVFMRIKGDAISHNQYNAAFALKHIAKDLRLAKQEGSNGPLSETAFETFQKAEPSFGNEDIIAVMKYLSALD